MSANLRPVAAAPQGPSVTSSDGEASANTRGRLGTLAPWAEEHDPGALDLASELLDAIRGTGVVAGRYTDNGIEEHARAQVRGDQHLRLVMLCRLLRSKHPVGRAAAVAFLAHAARQVGKVLADAPTSSGPIAGLEAAARISREAGEGVSALLTCPDLAHVEAQLVDIQQAVAGALEHVRALRGGGR